MRHWRRINKSHDRESVPKNWAERQLSVDEKQTAEFGRVHQDLVKFWGIS